MCLKYVCSFDPISLQYWMFVKYALWTQSCKQVSPMIQWDPLGLVRSGWWQQERVRLNACILEFAYLCSCVFFPVVTKFFCISSFWFFPSILILLLALIYASMFITFKNLGKLAFGTFAIVQVCSSILENFVIHL